MKRSTLLVFAFSVVGSFLTGAALPAAPPDAQALSLAVEADKDVIVILRDQVPSLPAVNANRAMRAATLGAHQSSLIAGLQQNRTRTVRSFKMINAFATQVSSAEAAQLANRPEVLAVVQDRIVRAPKRISGNKSAVAALAPPYGANTPSGPLCNTLEPEALQLMNVAFTDPTVPQAQSVLDGNGKPVTGRGVKVAFIADGLDINNPGFIRPDGSRVFFDYQNFTGDPAGTPTDGGEAFGDASSIAAQDMPNGKPLLFDLSQFFTPNPLPTPCNVRIRGVAPGASLAGLNIFSNLDYTTTSGIVQAIEYAVLVDDVDVINESFGYNPFYDNSLDPVSIANQAAVQAGVTVVASTGDAGTAGTLGTPATDPNVIGAGASTQFRAYSQVYEGVAYLTKGGWVSNNVSSLSSGGFAQLNARTVDVLAPGDLGWALCSSNVDVYEDCYNFNGQPSTFELFGGTSEASPLTAGTAALVIQAYRSTHGGASPSPALVKRLIMSTATDLGAPTFEQGAGLVNALAAVQSALSVKNGYGNPKASGSGLMYGPTAVTIADQPNASESTSVLVTNNGATVQNLALALQTLGAPFAGATVTVNLDAAHDPSAFPGDVQPYVNKTFTVAPGTDHLDASFAVPVTATTAPLIFLSLIDPSGRQAAYSLPQGVGNGYGHVDVVKPLPGKWTANISTVSTASPLSYSGPLQFTWAVENYVNLGSVSPSSLSLNPGASATVKAHFNTPSQPGDLAAAVRFKSTTNPTANYADVPVSVRTYIPTGPNGGTFSGTFTGGNGRSGGGPEQTYAFNVPAGMQNMSLVLEAPDNGYSLEGFLIDPNGMQLSIEANLDPLGAPQYGLSMFRYNPQPGLWRFVLLQNYYSSGNQTSLNYDARIGFNTAQVVATGMPDSIAVHLSASGKPVLVPIQVVNTGAVTTAFFADARLRTPVSTPLATTTQSPVASLLGLCNSNGTPYTMLPGACYQINVPPETSEVQFFAKASRPLDMDVANFAGFNNGGTLAGVADAPDLYAKKYNANTVVATLQEPAVPWGPWIATPAEVGPFGAAGAASIPVKMTAVAMTLPFDPNASADSGDIWADQVLGTATYNPLLLPSGEYGVINLTITPDPKHVGEVVQGYVYIDTFNSFTLTGDEVVRIPYKYTIVK